jgi:DNA repair protein RadC
MTLYVAEKKKIKKAEDVVKILRAVLKAESKVDQDKEHLWVIGLNTVNIIKYIELVTLGILDTTIFHPREIFRFAIMQGCSRIIVAHNHPSGATNPSTEDLKMIKQIKDAGDILLIKVIDSIIIGDDYWSAASEGQLINN